VRRAARRYLIGRYLNLEPAAIRFSAGDYGKPAIAGQERNGGLRFNCSRSADIALFAVSRGIELGVDVESHQRVGEVSELLDRVLSSAERVEFDRLPPALQRKAFFEVWTRKEALLKAAGLGLTLPPQRVEVTIAPGQPPACRGWAGDPDAAQRWQMVDLDVGTDCSATLALERMSAS
jgi:4'-phosphopantetheinyl transferase